uniref:Uncharacterized protein n=1 Tax=Glossina palpalis gambiensis TaxID=67801 RepID=A0A1B0BHF6_9MUSC
MIPFARFFTLIADNPFNIRRKSKEKELMGWLKVHYKGQRDYVFRSDRNCQMALVVGILGRAIGTAEDNIGTAEGVKKERIKTHSSLLFRNFSLLPIEMRTKLLPLTAFDQTDEQCYTSVYLCTINPPAARELKKPCNPWTITLPILVGNKSLDIS